MSENITARQVLKTAGIDLGVIAIAAVAGLAMDTAFSRLAVSRILRVVLQVTAIVLFIGAFRILDAKLTQVDLVTNVFFVSVFLGVQLNLLSDLRSYGGSVNRS